MNHRLMSRTLGGLALCAGAARAFAHEGHGLDGVHWHATDISGFLLVVVLATLALWLSRGE